VSSYDGPVVVGSKTLPPDPSLVSSIGLHHSLPTAIADLVDNSIDAEADRVLVRILQAGGRAVGLQVIDDGKGMDATTIDAAMTYARKRDYEEGALGHFGLGLKAASLSQADVLAVWSRARGCGAVGRLIDHQTVGRDHRVSELDSDQAAERLDTAAAGFEVVTGTIVEWRDVRTFLNSSNLDEQTSWLEQSINDIQNHLGLVLHRIFASGKLTVTIEVFDLSSGKAGVPRTVSEVNPFAYSRSGAADYPRKLLIELDGRAAGAVAHIWPPRSNASEFRLGGRPGREHQGFYFYRNDRLLQIGGWNGVVNPKPYYEFGRVAIDIGDVLQGHITINPEKSGLMLDATLAQALEAAGFDDGTGNFRDYLDDLEGGAREARKRNRRPIDVVEPRGGFPGDLLEAFEDSVRFNPDEDPVDIKWRALPPEIVFDVDRDRRTLWLNLRYRTTLVGHRSLDPDDAPVLKALFHLLASRHFEGSYAGAREKMELEAWQLILSAAVEVQARQQQARDVP
jgi:Histidine kinase-, DNA gyrase B-, and HSP90-like ATPase